MDVERFARASSQRGFDPVGEGSDVFGAVGPIK